MMTVLEHLGVGVNPIKNWTCCGTSSRLSQSPLLPYALPLKNLAQAEKRRRKGRSRALCRMLQPYEGSASMHTEKMKH